MKVLVLNPSFVNDFCRSARWAAKSRGRVQRHPDWLLIAAAVLEKAGHDVKFIDGAVLNLKVGDIERESLFFKPDLVVLHTTTPTIYNDIAYAKLLKDKTGAITALVGPHVSVETKDTFRIANNAVDIIIRGEYDYSLRDVASGRPFADIPGISFLRGRELIDNPDRPLLEVNELPPPAWHHIKPEWYFDGGKRFPFLTLISGRGCFGMCTFCRDIPIMYKRKLRLRSEKLIVDEIERDYRLFPYLKEIMFETDTFTADPGHVIKVCEEILKRNLRICWSCNTRVDMDLSVLPLMKRAGCRMLMTGFEFGTQEALDAVRKGISLEQSRNFAEDAHRLGFVIHGCFMFGAPGETIRSCQKTIEFARSLPLNTVQFSGICVYPGTDIYAWAKENGCLVPKDWTEWVGKDHEQTTTLSYSHLTKYDLDRCINKGLRQFYLRPEQVWRILSASKLDDTGRLFFGFRGFLKTLLKLK